MFFRIPAAVFWKVLSCLCFALLSTLVGLLSGKGSLPPLPPVEIAFFQNTLALCFLTILIVKENVSLRPAKTLPLHFLRAIFASAGISAWFIALSKIPLLHVIALKYLSPFITLLGAKFFLKETLGPYRIIAFVCAALGAVFISQENILAGLVSLKDFQWWTLLPVISTVAIAGSSLIGKKLTKAGEHPEKVSFYLLLFTSIILSSCLFHRWKTPHLEHLPWLLLMGFLSFVAYTSLNRAIALADLTYLLPFGFTRLIAGGIIGILVFGEWPSLWAYGGCALIIIGTIVLITKDKG